MQPLHLVCQKYVRKRKGAVKMCITCKNVTEMYVNCDSQNVHGFVYKVEIISLTFKWLIVLRYMIKRTESLKMCLPGPKKRKKTQVYASSTQTYYTTYEETPPNSLSTIKAVTLSFVSPV